MMGRCSHFLLSALLAAVVPVEANRAAASAPRAQAPLRLGLVANLTGSAAIYGISIRRGAVLAESTINAGGGINGRTLKLEVTDGATNTPKVIAAYHRFIGERKVLGILGPTLSSEAQTADPVAQKAGVPVLATSNTTPGITAMGSYIFRMSLGEAELVPVTIKTAMDRLHFKKAAVIYESDNAFTVGDGQIFGATAKAFGLDVVDTETYGAGTKDFSTQMTKIKGAHPDVIFAGSFAVEGAAVLVEARKLGIPESVHIIGGNGFNSPDLIKLAGRDAEGAISGTAWYPENTRALNKRFVSLYLKRYHREPDQFAAQAFDGMNIMAAGLRAARATPTRKSFRNALTTLKRVPVVTGATGLFHFTKTRDAGEQGTVQIVSRGKFKIYH